MTPPDRRRRLVACYWSPFLALALLTGEEAVKAETRRVKAGAKWQSHAEGMIVESAARHEADIIVLDSRTAKRLGVNPESRSVRVISPTEAKQILVPDRSVSHQALYDHLVNEQPSLERFVDIAPETGVTTVRPWQTVRLLAVALGLAAARVDRHLSYS